MDTKALPYFSEDGGPDTGHDKLTLSVPANTPVAVQDMALYAGRDYVVRSVEGGGEFAKRLDLQRA